MEKRVREKRIPWGVRAIGIVVVVLGGIILSVLSGAASADKMALEEPPSAPQLDVTMRKEVAEKFAQVLAGEYTYPDLGAKMAAAIKKRLKGGAYDSITSPLAFADALQADARAVVNDGHLGVMHQPPGSSPQANAQVPQQDAKINVIPEVKILDGNVGYLAVNMMLPTKEAQSTIAAAFALLKNTDALIVDLRGNPGGGGSTISLIEGYLNDGPSYVTDVIHWRKGNQQDKLKTADVGKLSYGSKKPVFVLTSPMTFSAAEQLSYDLQAFKRAVIVGQNTGGGSNVSNSGPISLGHGFIANVPTGYIVNAKTGTNWEGVGVKPNVSAPAEQALATAWSLAVKSLKTNANDPLTQAWLQGFSQAKLTGDPSLVSAELAGQYVSKRGGGPAVPVNIIEKKGKLYVQMLSARGVQDVALVSTGGDRYQPAWFPGGFSLTFVKLDGKVQLLKQYPGRLTILEK
jgi:hypothetical protein